MNFDSIKQSLLTSSRTGIIVTVLVCAMIFLIAARGFSDQGKYVEVKGSSEKIVKADRAIWSMSFEVKSNDINELYSTIDTSTQSVEKFLMEQGFTAEEINTAPVSVYQDTYRDAVYRYNANVQMSVFTDKVDTVRSSAEKTVTLIKKGIVFNTSYIDFQFSDLNSVKPEMLAEAIANARVSAQQFAKDARARLGGISRAQQGVFTITEKDPGSPEFKQIRVVSTVRFMLK